jgi:hypothetical protein
MACNRDIFTLPYSVYLIGIVGGGLQLGLLGTPVINRPIVPAPGDYDDGEIGGMMVGKGNRSARRKPAPLPLCPQQTPHACLNANLGRLGGKPKTICLSYDKALSLSCHGARNYEVPFSIDYFSYKLSKYQV